MPERRQLIYKSETTFPATNMMDVLIGAARRKALSRAHRVRWSMGGRNGMAWHLHPPKGSVGAALTHFRAFIYASSCEGRTLSTRLYMRGDLWKAKQSPLTEQGQISKKRGFMQDQQVMKEGQEETPAARLPTAAPLTLALNIYDGKIALGFGGPITGMTLTAQNALQLANRLRGMANQIQHDEHQAAAKLKRQQKSKK